MAPRIFDREPGLADPAEPMQRPADDRRALACSERRAEFVEVRVAAHEQGPERGERKVSGLARRHGGCFHQRVDDRRGENLRDEIVRAGKWRAGINVDRPQTLQVVGLRGSRGVRWRKGRAAVDTLGRSDDQQVFVEGDGEPCLPLRVAEARERLARNALLRQLGFEAGPSREQVVDAAWRGR